MVSKFDHCVVDLLDRWRTDELPAEIPVIVSNHMECEAEKRFFAVGNKTVV